MASLNPEAVPQWLPRCEGRTVRQQGNQWIATAQGYRFPSVTAILNATRPREHLEALAAWRQRVGMAEAASIASAASRRGTGTHRQIQHFLEGKPVDCTAHVQPYWESFLPVLQTLRAVRLVEGYVFHGDLGYAGQVDCIASYQGVPCVCEWKTADRPKGSVDRLYDYPLQLAAYCGAANATYSAHHLHITHALLVVGIPHHPAEVFWFLPDDLAGYWNQWQQRLTTYLATHNDRNRTSARTSALLIEGS